MDNNTQTTSALELPTEVLIDIAVENNEGVIASNGAFSTTTGSRTGRSPNDRFIVREPGTDDLIDWGDINKPFDEDKFDSLWNKVIHTLQKKIGMSLTFMLDLMLIITLQLKLY
jgi:Phosphoenolpyruvate carboxykinase (ATP)